MMFQTNERKKKKNDYAYCGHSDMYLRKEITFVGEPLNNRYGFIDSVNEIPVNRSNRNCLRYSAEMCKLGRCVPIIHWEYTSRIWTHR